MVKLRNLICTMEEEHDNNEEESIEIEDVGAAPGLPIEVEINDRYLDLVEDPLVRHALGYVAMNDEGAISTSRTRQKLLSWFNDHLKGGYAAFDPSRFRILNFLNTVWLAGCENLGQEFWWINRDSIQRLTYIAMVAEALHRQIHEKDHRPNIEEIPQSAVFVHDYIMNECGDEVFEDMNTDYVELLEGNAEFCDVYLKCFGGKKSKHHGEHDHNERRRRKKRGD